MGLLNYTTKIEPEQTISEIQRMLVRHGVSAMRTDYDGPNVESVSFQITLHDKADPSHARPIAFKLPCNWRAVREILKQEPRIKNTKLNSDEQAIRTAWRIIHTWIKGQLALVEVNMVTVPQVFLPYAVGHDGRTLAENLSDNPGFLLGEGK